MEQLKVESKHRTSGVKKFFRTFVIVLILALAGYIYWKYYYPYTSDGVKSGYLNFAVRKGQLFKTYEGNGGIYTLQSNGTLYFAKEGNSVEIKNFHQKAQRYQNDRG